MVDALDRREPSLTDQQGLLDDRQETYAIPLPDCPERAKIVTIDRRDRAAPRTLHGTLLNEPIAALKKRAMSRASGWLGLINPSREGKS